MNATPNNTDNWRRASFCDGGTCVEVAVSAHEVRVRDSKCEDGLGTVLSYTHAEWQAFVRGVKAREFDL